MSILKSKFILLKELTAIKDKSSWDKEDIRRIRSLIKTPQSNHQLIHKKSGCGLVFSKIESFANKSFYIKAGEQLREKLKKQRKGQQKSGEKTYDGITVEVEGGVYKKPGTIIEFMEKGISKSIDTIKKPKSDKIRYIGIELEFKQKSSNRNNEKEDIKKAINDAKLNRYCNLIMEHCGFELRTLIPENNFKSILGRILKVLNGMNYTVDYTCGTHMHFDMRDRNVEKCYNNLVRIQDVMYKLVPESRRGNNYCRPNSTDMTFGEDVSSNRRYQYVNVLSYEKHKTLEIRLHHGSLKLNELYNWIKIILKAINHDKEIEYKVSTPEELVKVLPFKSYEKKALKKRYETHNNETIAI